MAFDDRPKINERISKSESMVIQLDLKIMKLIEEFEKENDYEFLPYELDDMFLKNIRRNHQSYLRAAFKDGK